MVSFADIKEVFYTALLIAGFSVAGFFTDAATGPSPVAMNVEGRYIPTPISLVANPVVQISVPAHNIFEN